MVHMHIHTRIAKKTQTIHQDEEVVVVDAGVGVVVVCYFSGERGEPSYCLSLSLSSTFSFCKAKKARSR